MPTQIIPPRQAIEDCGREYKNEKNREGRSNRGEGNKCGGGLPHRRQRRADAHQSRGRSTSAAGNSARKAREHRLLTGKVTLGATNH
ncbi:hypothetical protein HPB48_005682 [Haemaphysalis longicornis]|uniref:Uncharacterized protein n=1 Tax=Haemaphysalis longicornis TaxID=44386 RepID=A0A9J6GUE2_HAELO|nr:hypothetical protein HPB48_005682 [Haemaphysalis longicornis]